MKILKILYLYIFGYVDIKVERFFYRKIYKYVYL